MKEIPLTNRRVAFVDDDDFDRICMFKWHYSKEYAVRTRSNTKVYMHREILNIPSYHQSGIFVDHINGCKLDNRKINIRLSTMSQNIANSIKTKNLTSKYKGVHWDSLNSKYVAQIMKDRRSVFLGRFESEYDAAIAYDSKAIELFGPFARTNILKNVEIPTIPSASEKTISLSRLSTRTKGEIKTPPGISAIPLTQGMFAIISDCDRELISRYKWYYHRGPKESAKRNITLPNGKQGGIYMHREILGIKIGDNVIVDHRDGNSLNNTRENLRITDSKHNNYNTKMRVHSSIFKGVYFNKKTNRWESRICGRYIGSYRNEADAAKSYNSEAVKFFGDFARLNEIT